MKYLFALIVLAAVGAALWYWVTKEESIPSLALAAVDIADTPEAREQGLSGRAEIPDDYGMLFVFSEPEMPAFWMKDMQTSIDIIWLDEQYRILEIDHSVSPDSYPETFGPPEPVRYVLETRAGLAMERGWTVGSKITVPSN